MFIGAALLIAIDHLRGAEESGDNEKTDFIHRLFVVSSISSEETTQLTRMAGDSKRANQDGTVICNRRRMELLVQEIDIPKRIGLRSR